MKTSDRKALINFLVGTGVVLSSLFIFILVFIILVFLFGGVSLPDKKFTVVDSYKGCDIVRYAPDGSGKFHYFLDCEPVPPGKTR